MLPTHSFMRSMGLDPLPERCALKMTDYGAFAGRAPGVLYVCGHAEIGTHHYQYPPILWACRGYPFVVKQKKKS